jgi:O-antigen/teichoic acid export membrane protein
MAGFGAAQVLRFSFNLYLTRLLLPEAFGLMALVDLFLTGLQMFSDVGVGASIVRSPRGDDPDYVNGAWSVQVVRGFLLWGCACALAWPAAAFYDEPQLKYLLAAAGLSAAIAGFNSCGLFLCTRHLLHGRVILLQLGGYFSCVVVTMVWLLCIDVSVWSLIVGKLTGSLIELIATHWVYPSHRSRFVWDPVILGEILHFGKWIFVGTACLFLSDQVDRLIVGKVTSLSTLGVYNLAVQLALAAKLVVHLINMRIFFPLYSRVIHQGQTLRSAIRRLHPWAAGFAAFATAGLVASGPAFIRCAFKPDWQEAGWMLQWTAVAVGIASLQSIAGCLLLAVGNSRGHAAGNFVKLLVLPVCAWVGYHAGGFAGMLAGFVVAELVRYTATLWVLRGQAWLILRCDLALAAAVALSWLAADVAGAAFALGGRRWPQFAAQVIAVVAFWGVLAAAVYGRGRLRRVTARPIPVEI